MVTYVTPTGSDEVGHFTRHTRRSVRMLRPDRRAGAQGSRVPSDIADAGLAEQGRRRIDFAERAMPVLGLLRQRYEVARPLAGTRIAACMHVTAEMAALARTLTAGGAELSLAASNPLSTQDDIAAALVAE